MIFYDFEVFKYDWMVCWLDTDTKKTYSIVNDKAKLEKFYNHYKDIIWVGYNSRNYDQWICKAILCDFNPWEMNDWIIMQDKKGYLFSNLLNDFPIINYDALVGSGFSAKSLKELEAFMGHSIHETSVPFDLDRPLTKQELKETEEYCMNDVMELFHVFIEKKEEFESHMGLVKEYKMHLSSISKTKAQLSAMILGAQKKKRNDEFDIRLPDTLQMGKYQWIADWYLEAAKQCEDFGNYDPMSLKTEVGGIPHTFGIGGIHGSIDNYMGDGLYLMADVASFYPAIMIEYDMLSRNVKNPQKYTEIRDERITMKANRDPRQAPRKIVLNSTYGASKDKYNNLYDPLQGSNVCIAGQLLLVDLIDKLDGKCQLIQSNTDGILIKLFYPGDKEEIIKICQEWTKRTRMELEFDEYVRVIQKDVNNYIIVDSKGKVKRKGAYVKKLSPLDNDLPIVNKAVVDYFVNNIPVEQTIMAAENLIDFQKVTKVSRKYDYAVYNGVKMYERVYRVFASKDPNDGTLYKKHKSKENPDKTAGTPDNCFIENGDITDSPVPAKLDRQWYIDLAKERIQGKNGFLK